MNCKLAYHRLRQVLILADTGIVELWAGVLTTMWGIWLLWSEKVFGFNRAYLVMSKQMNSDCWGSILLGVGLIQIFSFLFLSYRLRKVTAFFLFFLWMYLTITIYMSLEEGTSSFIVCVYSSITALLAWAYIRIGIIVNGEGARRWNLKT